MERCMPESAKTLDPAYATAPAMDRHGLERLLTAVATGDAQAFERLYHATSAKLFGVCLRLLPDRDDAEDVLQDAYVAIWRKAAQYDATIASPISWLAMIAHNKAIDRLRSEGPARQSVPIDFAEDISDASPGAVTLAEHAGEARRLDQCLQRLEAKRRTLIRTAFFDGATYEELARHTDTPVGTVKSWIRRGLLQLRTCLET
jgi:RNA polymerase sigma-70 factor (ECF subfamily)